MNKLITLSPENDSAVAMNKLESPSLSTTVNVHTEQPVVMPAVEEKDLSINFFIVGGIINITMITAYFICAFKAWK